MDRDAAMSELVKRNATDDPIETFAFMDQLLDAGHNDIAVTLLNKVLSFAGTLSAACITNPMLASLALRKSNSPWLLALNNYQRRDHISQIAMELWKKQEGPFGNPVPESLAEEALLLILREAKNLFLRLAPYLSTEGIARIPAYQPHTFYIKYSDQVVISTVATLKAVYLPAGGDVGRLTISIPHYSGAVSPEDVVLDGHIADPELNVKVLDAVSTIEAAHISWRDGYNYKRWKRE